MYTNVNLVLLMLCMLVPIAQMQRWAGTYAWDGQCKASSCCCYAGTLSVSQSGSNLIFTSDTSGCGSSSISSTFSNPNGYSFSATGTRNAQVVYSLSSDSNTLTVRNTVYGACGGSAARTSVGINRYPSIISLIGALAVVKLLL